MSALLDSNPDYKKVTVLHADWDTFKEAPIATELAITRRSTLIMFNGGEEIGRLVAETNDGKIEALFKQAVL